MVQLLSFDIGIKNMAYCFIKINQDKSINFCNLNKIDLNIPKKSNIQNIIDNTIDFLDITINQDLTIDNNDKLIILIECQMTSIMKTIQTTINTYFKLIGRFSGFDIETIYLSPKHKLNIINKYEGKIDKSKYKQNKLEAIYFCKYLLENVYHNQSFLDIYNSHKKKDDISDAYLMCIYYYENIILS
jgi:hypothetical protein